ncbi:MAG: hypothetical protein ACRDTA_24675 [Pseudonocardiaceae bacterium]
MGDPDPPGGVILTDVKTSLMAGSLVRLTRYPDRAEGHFDRTYAAFLGLRHHAASQDPAIRPRPRRQHQVTEAGPTRVWRIIEDTHALWTGLDQPGWERFGLTVTENHQHVWLDTPTNQHTWPLPSRPATQART